MYGCPGCGSVMTFSVQDQALKCGSCGRTQSIEEADQREARTAGSSFSVDLLTCPTCGAEIRAIIDSDERPKEYSKTVRFSLKPHKVHLFHRETEERLN